MVGVHLINLVTKARPWEGEGGERGRESSLELLVSFKFQCFVPESWQWSTSKTQKKCFKLWGRQAGSAQFLQSDQIFRIQILWDPNLIWFKSYRIQLNSDQFDVGDHDSWTIVKNCWLPASCGEQILKYISLKYLIWEAKQMWISDSDQLQLIWSPSSRVFRYPPVIAEKRESFIQN